MGPVSIGVEVERNTDGDTPSSRVTAGVPQGIVYQMGQKQRYRSNAIFYRSNGKI